MVNVDRIMSLLESPHKIGDYNINNKSSIESVEGDLTESVIDYFEFQSNAYSIMAECAMCGNFNNLELLQEAAFSGIKDKIKQFFHKAYELLIKLKNMFLASMRKMKEYLSRFLNWIKGGSKSSSSNQNNKSKQIPTNNTPVENNPSKSSSASSTDEFRKFLDDSNRNFEKQKKLFDDSKREHDVRVRKEKELNNRKIQYTGMLWSLNGIKKLIHMTDYEMYERLQKCMENIDHYLRYENSNPSDQNLNDLVIRMFFGNTSRPISVNEIPDYMYQQIVGINPNEPKTYTVTRDLEFQYELICSYLCDDKVITLSTEKTIDMIDELIKIHKSTLQSFIEVTKTTENDLNSLDSSDTDTRNKYMKSINTGNINIKFLKLCLVGISNYVKTYNNILTTATKECTEVIKLFNAN